MFVKTHVLLCHPEVNCQAGGICEVPEELGAALIENGQAVRVNSLGEPEADEPQPAKRAAKGK